MVSNLYGNPHSASPSSQITSNRIEEARTRLLQFFNADPEHFDVVFVANATAGTKLVMDAFREADSGFWYGYHRDSHTSLVGVRESAKTHQCFESDSMVERWLSKEPDEVHSHVECDTGLFAYPAQSNMNGRRLPLTWARDIRKSFAGSVYTLLDAAALVSTSPLNLEDVENAPDFTVLSLYKIFGFPDFGALIVRKSCEHIFQRRRYFGGGTVDMALCLNEQWFARKTTALHDQLEDGTLPIHSIMAVQPTMDVHRDLFGSLQRVSSHCAYLSNSLYKSMCALSHGNGLPVCEMYNDPNCDFTDVTKQGPIIAFNLKNNEGGWVPNSELEKLAAIKNISLRTGGLCNPGGIASSLRLKPWEMKRNFSAGQRCGNDYDIMHGKPTGMARVSLGAMSTMQDVGQFLRFLEEFFVQANATDESVINPSAQLEGSGRYFVESLAIYPIKSCAGWKIPSNQPWPVHREGLEWDREWCLVRAGSGAALSQKRYPRMALIKPVVDVEQGVLRVSFADATARIEPIEVPLSSDPTQFGRDRFAARSAVVCGDKIAAHTYESPAITSFFTLALSVACQLARFPPTGSGVSVRHAKAHLQPHQRLSNQQENIPGAFPQSGSPPAGEQPQRPILLSNESPVLVISRSSLNRLNEQIKLGGGRAVHADVFRANIVIAERPKSPPGSEQPYAEDSWRFVRVGRQHFQMLGSCRRCQMVCINQDTAKSSGEPFVTLAKFRRFDGKVYFGQHACHLPAVPDSRSPDAQQATVAVGDDVQPS